MAIRKHVQWNGKRCVGYVDIGTGIETDARSGQMLYPRQKKHMIKLIRNTLADWRALIDSEGKIINWNYFKKLVDLHENEGLHAANKLSRRHINFKKEIMKVKFAVQVFSRSVAESLFCSHDPYLPQFEEVDATANFCLIINGLFDALNSRNVLSRSLWGQPLTLENKFAFVDLFKRSVQYLSTLKTVDSTNILDSFSILSIQNIFGDVVKITEIYSNI